MRESELLISKSRSRSRSRWFQKRGVGVGVGVVYIKSAESESESESLFFKLGCRSRSRSRGKKSSTPQPCLKVALLAPLGSFSSRRSPREASKKHPRNAHFSSARCGRLTSAPSLDLCFSSFAMGSRSSVGALRYASAKSVCGCQHLQLSHWWLCIWH